MRPSLTIIIAVALLSPLSLAQSWTLTTSDFRQQPVSVRGVHENGVDVTVGNQQRTVGFDEFLQVERSLSARGEAPFVLLLHGGDRIAGQPLRVRGTSLVWRTPQLGEMTIPLANVLAMVRSGRTLDNPSDQPREYRVMLLNGDSVRDILLDITDQRIDIETSVGEVPVPMSALAYLHFAPTGRPQILQERGFRVRLADGTQITTQSLELDGSNATLRIGQEDRRVPVASIGGIEQINGPVSWLSSRTPARAEQIPWFGDLSWPTRMDTTVSGRPITFDRRVYNRGIGVHAYSRLEFELDGTYRTFRTQYAIAQEHKRQYADVTVRIYVDDRLVHEQENFRADVLSPVVSVDVQGGRRLVLEVDYGQANDTQDRFNWIEPALLR